MALPKLKPSQEVQHKFSVSAIEFEKVRKIMKWRKSSGVSAYELSFLLGKSDFFVRDIENPLDTKRYNIDDTNYFLLISDRPRKFVLPSKIEDDADTYQIEVIYYLSTQRRPTFKIRRKREKGDINFDPIAVEQKHIDLPTKLDLFSFKEVQFFIDHLLADNFFLEAKRALDIFKKCQEEFGINFHPRNMVKVIDFYTNKKSGIYKLNKDRVDKFGRRLFVSAI